ncbi:prolactin receptor a [Chanos chanos]|uniref:Prolactin receptor n=1 Tax=Chanos chanos TaxID=29144 RepID=A0A6J2UUB7_CHACN|nr:prolactin receptor [Chanos chanos]
MQKDALLILLLAGIFVSVGARHSVPGKPKKTSCRSPEKETFTCWWEPGDDGGLPTTYALYYRLEGDDRVYECPDYKTAGENSCFFNKSYTSLWVNYNITVVAKNALGQAVSDPVEVDVVYIVKPNSPENVNVKVMEDDHGPFLRVSWDKPPTADTRSGWITLNYQIRVKLENEKEWEEHEVGLQKTFNVFGLHSGGVYMVQVRCKPDHGFWSEWSSTTYVTVPDYIPRGRSMWILIGTFSAFFILIIIWTAKVNQNSVKHFILPPIPGPKIKGFDKQLLKSGKSEEVLNALVIQSFPPTSDYEDLLVQYLEVYDNEERLVLDTKDIPEGCLKCKTPSDSDSGRGSCDSHTLLLEKSGEATEESGRDHHQHQKNDEASWASTESSDGKVPRAGTLKSVEVQGKAWPTVFSPQHHHDAAKVAYHSMPIPVLEQKECHLEEFRLSKPHGNHGNIKTHTEFNLNGEDCERETVAVSIPSPHLLEYVEVQRVNQENVLLVRPLHDEGYDPDQPTTPAAEDYSKVKGIISDNILLLQMDMAAPSYLGEYHQSRTEQVEQCVPQNQQTQSCKPAVHVTSIMLQEGMHLASNGYVDSAAMMGIH